jgi:hypothetical protein
MTVYGLQVHFGLLEPQSIVLVLHGVHLLFALPLVGRRAVIALLLQVLTVLLREFLDFPALLNVVVRRVVYLATRASVIATGCLMGALITLRTSAHPLRQQQLRRWELQPAAGCCRRSSSSCFCCHPLGGPRTSQLRSSKSLLVNSSSREVSGIRPPSSKDEDRSTTRTFSKGPPCSNNSEQGQHEKISDGDPGGSRDPKIVDRGVEPPFDEEEPSLEGEREHLVPLLSSVVAKRSGREGKPKQSQEGM